MSKSPSAPSSQILPPAPLRVRSEIPTLAMGDNVNAPSGSLPPPPVLPPHLAAIAPSPSVPGRLPPLAAPSRALSSTLPPRRSGAHPTASRLVAAGHSARAWAARWLHASRVHGVPLVLAFGRRLRSWLLRWLRESAERAARGARAAVAWVLPRWVVARARCTAAARTTRAWLRQDPRRWSLPAALALVLCAVGFRLAQQPHDDFVGEAIALGETPTRSPAPSAGALPARDPVHGASAAMPPTKPGPTRPGAAHEPTAAPFAVRPQRAAMSCDAALGRSFTVQEEPNPRKAGELWSAARKSLLRGKKDRALAEMCEGASWDLAGRATYGLSEFYFREGDFAQALTWTQRVPKSSRRWVDARAMIGDVHSQLGQPEQARAAFLQAWNQPTADSRWLTETASDLAASARRAFDKKDHWTAERFYRRALTLDGEQVEAAAGLARVLAHEGHAGAALAWAEHAARRDPRSASAAVAVCEAHLALRDAPAARRALDRLRALAPGDPNVEGLAARVASL